MACALVVCSSAEAAQGVVVSSTTRSARAAAPVSARPSRTAPNPAPNPASNFGTQPTRGGIRPPAAETLALDVSASSATRLESVMAIMRARDPKAAPRLAARFDGETQPAIRAWLVRGAAALDARRGAVLARKALQDANPMVRLAAAEALAKADGVKAVADLSTALAGEKNPGVRHGIVARLGAIKSPAAVAALQSALSGDPDPSVRLQAARSLQRQGTAPALQAVKNAAKDADPRVRAIANGP